MMATAEAQLLSAVELRAGQHSDADFIYDSWLNSYRDNNAEVREVPAVVYFPMHRALVRRLLRASYVVVVCSRQTPTLLLAWAVFTGETLHYLYVKARYRGFELTPLLLSALPKGVKWFSHRTPKMQRVAAQLGLTFNPYMCEVET